MTLARDALFLRGIAVNSVFGLFFLFSVGQNFTAPQSVLWCVRITLAASLALSCVVNRKMMQFCVAGGLRPRGQIGGVFYSGEGDGETTDGTRGDFGVFFFFCNVQREAEMASVGVHVGVVRCPAVGRVFVVTSSEFGDVAEHY